MKDCSTGLLVMIAFTIGAIAQESGPGSADLRAYFEKETRLLAGRSLVGLETLADWEKETPRLRRELLEMLGLHPGPERTPLEATVTGVRVREDFTVENLHFQSRPGLYVTGNLYLPKNRKGRVPAILYGSGHGAVKKNGI
ncbi:MAG: acetylxylan esterase, partial [Verrucomicrobiota bacterium]